MGYIKHTKRRSFSDILPQQVARADRLDLRELLHEALSLRAFADAWRTHQNDARGLGQLRSCHGADYNLYIVVKLSETMLGIGIHAGMNLKGSVGSPLASEKIHGDDSRVGEKKESER